MNNDIRLGYASPSYFCILVEKKVKSGPLMKFVLR